MRLLVLTLALAILTSVPVLAQKSTLAGTRLSLAVGDTGGFPSQDTSADQATKPGELKSGTTLIGCLSGPDSNGKLTLRSMSHRTGVEVFGPIDLKDDSGSKVKLTGSWKPSDQPTVKGKEALKFQATEIEVLAQKCEAPSEKTPVGKEKQQKQQQQQKQKASASAPASGDATNPKQ